jgi:hypothetical protein
MAKRLARYVDGVLGVERTDALCQATMDIEERADDVSKVNAFRFIGAPK